jgi:hypothetical protein
METKVCEGGCGRTFVRPVPANARLGRKMCDHCRTMKLQEREAQYEAQRVREAGARLGVFV